MMGVHYAVLLWVFSGQMQWLPFMTLCRGFMTGARAAPMGFWAVPKHVHTRRAPSRIYTNTCI